MRNVIVPKTNTMPRHQARVAARLLSKTCPVDSPRRVSANCEIGWLRTYGRSHSGKVFSGAIPVESMNSSS